MTIGELKAKLRDSRKPYVCRIDDMNLSGQEGREMVEVRHRDVQRLIKGEVPESVNLLMIEENKLDPERPLCDFGFPDQEHCNSEEIGYDFQQLAVLLEYPERITRRYRRELGHSPGDSMDYWDQGLSCGVSETLVATYKWLGSLFNAMRVTVMRPKTI